MGGANEKLLDVMEKENPWGMANKEPALIELYNCCINENNGVLEWYNKSTSTRNENAWTTSKWCIK